MKKLAVIIVTFLSITLFSQEKFELTPKGFVSDEKDYIVMEFSNKTAKELYTLTKMYLSSIYKSPKDVLSEVEDKMMTVNAISRSTIRRNSFHAFDMNYTIVFKFKDNKIRIDAPSFKLTTFTNKHQTLHLNWAKMSLGGENLGIYGKKQKLKSKKAKADLEKFFNNYIANFKKSFEKQSDDW